MASTAALELLIQLKDNASAGMKSLGGQANMLGIKFEDSSKKGGLLGSAINSLVSPLGLATIGVGTFVGGLVSAVNAAMEEQIGIERLNQALQNNIPGWMGNTAAIEATIEARQKLAFSDDQLRDSLGTLVTRTHDVAEAFDLQSLAMDLARGKNIDLQTSSEIVGKVLDGNVGILNRYGIAVKDGATATEALAAIQTTFAGQAQAYSDTAAGGIDKLKNAFDNAMETIGGAVLPAVGGLATKLSELIPQILSAAGAVLDFFKPAFDVIGGLLEGIPKFFKPIGDALDGLKQMWQQDWLGIGTLLGQVADDIGTKIKMIMDSAKWLADNLPQGLLNAFAPSLAIAENFKNDLRAKAIAAGGGFRLGFTEGVTGMVENLASVANRAIQVARDMKDPMYQAAAAVAATWRDTLFAGMAGALPSIVQVANSVITAVRAPEAPAGVAGSNIGTNWVAGINNSIAAGIPTLNQNILAIKGALSRMQAVTAISWKGPLKPGQTPGDVINAEISRLQSELEANYRGIYLTASAAANNPLLSSGGMAATPLVKAPGGGGGGGGGGSGKGGGGSSGGAGGAAATQVDPLQEASKIAAMVGAAVESLSKLRDFKAIGDEALNNFFAALDGVITRMNSRISLWWGKWGEVQANIAKGVGDAVVGILAGVGPLQTLASGFKPVSDEALDNFFTALDGVIARMNDRMPLWWGRWGAVQADIAKGVGAAVAGVLGAVGPLKTLADGFKPIATDALDNFFTALDAVIARLQERMPLWWGRWGVEQAAIAKGAADAVSGILGAVGPLATLAKGFDAVATPAIDNFFTALDDVIQRLSDRMSLWWGRWGVVQSAIAKGVGDSVAGVLGAIAPLANLAKGFAGISVEAIDNFFAALDQVIQRIQDRLPYWWGRWGKVQSDIAKGVGDAIGGVLSAIDPIMKLADFKPIDPANIEAFMASVWEALNQLKIVVQGLPAGFLDAAAGWGDKVKSVFDGLKTALDVIGGLTGVDESSVGGALSTMLTGIQGIFEYIRDTAIGVIDTFKTRTGEMKDAWNGAWDSMATTTEKDVQRIITAMNRLPGGTTGGTGEYTPPPSPFGGMGARGMSIGNVTINAGMGANGRQIASDFVDELGARLGMQKRNTALSRGFA